VFIRHSSARSVVLVIYIDNILLTNNDTADIEKAKLLNAHFMTKDMGRPRYSLGIEISHNKQGAKNTH